MHRQHQTWCRLRQSTLWRSQWIFDVPQQLALLKCGPETWHLKNNISIAKGLGGHSFNGLDMLFSDYRGRPPKKADGPCKSLGRQSILIRFSMIWIAMAIIWLKLRFSIHFHGDSHAHCFPQWIGLRENRKPWIFPWNMVFSCKISLKPIHWFPDSRKLGNNNPKFDDLESLDPFSVAQCHVVHPQVTIQSIQNSVVSSTSPVMVYGSQGFPHYPLVIQHSYWKSPLLIGKSTRTGPFSIVMSNDQRVYSITPPLLTKLLTIINHY